MAEDPLTPPERLREDWRIFRAFATRIWDVLRRMFSMRIWRELFKLEFILGWGFIGFVFATGLGMLGLETIFHVESLTSAEVFFVVAGLLISAKIVQIAVTTEFPFWERALFTFVLFGLVGVGIVELIKVIEKRRPIITKSVIPQPNPSTHFRVAISTLVKYRFPGILFLLYSDSTSEYLAPVGLQVLVSVTNNDPTVTKIEGYAADVLIGDQWIRVFSLPGIDPKSFFLAQEETLTKAHRIDFSENSFDTLAKNRLLQSGEPLKGWMFFEWPANLRYSDSDVPIRKLRLHIENASGQRETHELDLPARLSNGESEIKGDWAGWIFPEEVNIRGRPIKPYMDRKAEAAARIENLNKQSH